MAAVRNEIPLPPFSSINPLFTSIVPHFNLFLPNFYLNLTSAKPAISNHFLEATAYRPLGGITAILVLFPLLLLLLSPYTARSHSALQAPGPPTMTKQYLLRPFIWKSQWAVAREECRG